MGELVLLVLLGELMSQRKTLVWAAVHPSKRIGHGTGGGARFHAGSSSISSSTQLGSCGCGGYGDGSGGHVERRLLIHGRRGRGALLHG